MKNVTKLSTITKKQREENPKGYSLRQNRMLDKIVNSRPRFNVSVTVSGKPF